MILNSFILCMVVYALASCIAVAVAGIIQLMSRLLGAVGRTG